MATPRPSMVPSSARSAAVLALKLAPLFAASAFAWFACSSSGGGMCTNDCPPSGGSSGTGVTDAKAPPHDAPTLPLDTGSQGPDRSELDQGNPGGDAAAPEAGGGDGGPADAAADAPASGG